MGKTRCPLHPRHFGSHPLGREPSAQQGTEPVDGRLPRRPPEPATAPCCAEQFRGDFVQAGLHLYHLRQRHHAVHASTRTTQGHLEPNAAPYH
jgi:hypothetical protein